jgi:hypothetical protein
LQKPWIAQDLQGFAKFPFCAIKDINELRNAKIWICKFLFGGIEGYQAVAREKIWKYEIFSKSPLDPPPKPILRPLMAASFPLAHQIQPPDRMRRKSWNVQKMFWQNRKPEGVVRLRTAPCHRRARRQGRAAARSLREP